MFIRDFQSDFEFSEIIAILTSTSRLYIVQKQRGFSTLPYLCHVTYVLDCSTITNCVNFQGFFLLGQAYRQKIVLMMTEQPQGATPRTVLYEYVIENPFDVKQAREYPTLDYSVSTIMKHFSDSQYVYIGVNRQGQHYYLVYDSKEGSSNVLAYRIPVSRPTNIPVLIGQLNNETSHAGLGVIDTYLFSVTNSTLITKLSEEKERAIKLAVRNDNNEMILFKYSVTIDLSSSKVSYAGGIPSFNFSEDIRTNELVLRLDKLSGPIEDIDITERCEDFDITRKDLIQADRCITYYNRTYGELLSFSSLSLLAEMEVAMTSFYLLCIKQREVLQTKRWTGNCTFREFSEELSDNFTEKLIMLCMKDDANSIHLLEVDSNCGLTINDLILDLDIRYYDVQASYPFVMLEVPILLPENKDYYVCRFDDRNKTVSNCTALVKAAQTNFLSLDFDLRMRYGLILEKGLGIYDLNKITANRSLDASLWVSEAELA